MKVPKHLVTLVVGILAGGIVAVGATAAVEASASGTNVTYYGCLSTRGALSKVGTVSPVCTATAHVINWDSTGTQGPPGPAGATPAAPNGNGVLATPITLTNSNYTPIEQTLSPLALPGPAAHNMLITGEFTVHFVSCTTNCGSVVVAGDLGINSTVSGIGPFATTLQSVGSFQTITMSGILSWGPGSTYGAMWAQGTWPTGDVIQCTVANITAVDLGPVS